MGLMSGLGKIKDWTVKMNAAGAKLSGIKEDEDGKKTIKLNPKRGEGVAPTTYPLSPVKPPKKSKKLPAYLKQTKYRGLM